MGKCSENIHLETKREPDLDHEPEKFSEHVAWKCCGTSGNLGKI